MSRYTQTLAIMYAMSSLYSGAGIRNDNDLAVRGYSRVSDEDRHLRMGLKKFNIEGEVIYAINHKTALRKYAKKRRETKVPS